MRPLVSSSFRSRLFGAVLAASLLPILMRTALLLLFSPRRIAHRTTPAVDRYLVHSVQ